MRRIARMVIVGCALVVWTGLVHAQSGYDLLQQALVEERSNGQVQEAIELYRRIISEHASDRALTATALVRLGCAYETLGSQEARQAYERVVSEYADQRDMASEVRARLSAIARSGTVSAAKTMAARQVWTDPGDFGGLWSADGKYLAFRSRRGPDDILVVRSIESGAETVVTREVRVRPPQGIQWHPDGGSLFVEGEYRGRRGVFQVDLRTDGAVPEFVNEGPHPRFDVLSADGSVMYWVDRQVMDDRGRIVRTDLATGVESELYAGRLSRRIVLSPDNRTIVFAAHTDEMSTLNAISTSGGMPRRLTDLVYRGERVGMISGAWTPDGDILFFGRCCGVVQLFQVSATGGDLEPAGLVTMLPNEATQSRDPNVVFRMRNLKIRPDGRQISFTGQRILGPPAVWALEDFLPTSSEAR